MESFSDGVFGFAITLLVLDIHVPTITEGQKLLDLLLADWPTYLSFLIGFFTILVCWINHHYMFDHIYKNNSKLLLLNGFKLLVVTFTPFATALLSKYINTPQQSTAVGVYALNFALMGTSMYFIWLHAVRMDLMKHESEALLKMITRYYFLAPAMSVTIFILSFINIWICLGFSGIMFATFLFPEQMMAFAMRRLGSR
ncbi:DUF1211 domain-containing protein [Fulvivirgaceae bacterium PWU37]|uniref:DUF1211 domain-containing protein n=1 Tax=Dawidia soli TaxID=2782352 RepID=A0AAP2DAY8_9BACT|nr:DUF1211 domain-containing protein [Dawidia soli]